MNNTVIINLQRAQPVSVNAGLIPSITQSLAFKISLFFAAHVMLGLMMIQFPVMSTIHALATMVVGFWLAVSSRQVDRVVYCIAYIAGSEVLWRMTQAQVFWEFGKYAVAAILLVSMLKTGQLRGFAVPFLYFALLLPSLVMPMANATTEELRGQVSFNLSGHLAMMVCLWFFSQTRMYESSYYRIFLFLTAPIIGVGTVTLMGTFKASVLRFGNESNFTTSGGFGPNQVSAALGMGVLALFLYLLVEKKNRGLKPLLFALMIAMAAQSAMTFSRTGLYNAGVSAIAATFYLVRETRARMKLLGLIACIFLIANYLLLPRLEAFTSGTLLKRFQSTSLTGRDAIIRADLQVWSENPIFGVGPGGAIPYRAVFHRESAAHTEFTRLVAEHGVFGFVAVLLLLAVALRNLLRARTAQAKAMTVAMTCWSFGFMLVTAMRMVAPAVLFGFASIILLIDDPGPEKSRKV
jgi:O-antigen ligase